MARIDASIVTYHTDPDELSKCLDSLLASTEVGRVHIVDNSSDDATARLCRRYGPRVTYTPHPNTGYGDAHNVAIRRSVEGGTPFQLVINSDVFFGPGTLEACLSYFDANPDTVQLIPHTVFPDGREQYVVHPLPTPWDMFMRAFLPERMFARRRARYNLTNRRADAPLDVPYHHGCFMLMRTDALDRSGGFDPRFFMYPEDIDLTRRMHRIGSTVWYPGATIVHAHRAESKHNSRMRRIHIVNMLRYFCKWGFFFDRERRRLNRRLFSSLASAGK